MPNSVPEKRPIPAVRVKTDVTSAAGEKALRATEISITPKTEIAMATSVIGPTVSLRKTRPNSAACAGSVREYAVPTVKLRKEKRWMSMKVAAICDSAPRLIQPRKAADGGGTGSPVKAVSANK